MDLDLLFKYTVQTFWPQVVKEMPAKRKPARKASSPPKLRLKKILLKSSSNSGTNTTYSPPSEESIALSDDAPFIESGPEEEFIEEDGGGVPDFEALIQQPAPRVFIPNSGRLTSRQRAILEEETNSVSVEEPAAPHPKRQLTEEQLLARSEEARRRKNAREQALEERKDATIQRLLAKQSARKPTQAEASQRQVKETKAVGAIRYELAANGSTWYLPAKLLASINEVARKKSSVCGVCGANSTCKAKSTPFCGKMTCYRQIA